MSVIKALQDGPITPTTEWWGLSLRGRGKKERVDEKVRERWAWIPAPLRRATGTEIRQVAVAAYAGMTEIIMGTVPVFAKESGGGFIGDAVVGEGRGHGGEFRRAFG
ncbi:MAG: hypothetical protein HY747_06980 [Elusimicrobia bacterium]|nr:hypothetical protein [Elusimicrobiota bacterium]